MKITIGLPMALLGALIVGWAVVLLAWNLYLFWFPSVDYKVGTDDESIAMTGKRGETITLLLNPGESVAAKWATSGITLSLTSPTLDPIDVEVVPFREPDWEEEIRTFSILEHVGLEIKGEFTIPRKLGKLAATGESTGASDPAEPGTYLGSLAGMVLMPVAFGEGNFATSALPVSYDVKLTVVSGEVSAAPAWTFVKNWLGPSWRNLGILVGIGAALFFTGAYMIPEGIGKREEDEGEPSPESVLEAMCNETGTRAIEEADEAIGLNPQDAAAYSNRGNAYARSGEHERAIRDYDEAIRLSPEVTATYAYRGGAFDSLGQVERAIPDYNEAIRLDPRYAPVYQYRGQAYASSGQVERAIQDHDELIRLTPQDTDAFIW